MLKLVKIDLKKYFIINKSYFKANLKFPAFPAFRIGSIAQNEKTETPENLK